MASSASLNLQSATSSSLLSLQRLLPRHHPDFPAASLDTLAHFLRLISLLSPTGHARFRRAPSAPPRLSPSLLSDAPDFSSPPPPPFPQSSPRSTDPKCVTAATNDDAPASCSTASDTFSAGFSDAPPPGLRNSLIDLNKEANDSIDSTSSMKPGSQFHVVEPLQICNRSTPSLVDGTSAFPLSGPSADSTLSSGIPLRGNMRQETALLAQSNSYKTGSGIEPSLSRLGFVESKRYHAPYGVSHSTHSTLDGVSAQPSDEAQRQQSFLPQQTCKRILSETRVATQVSTTGSGLTSCVSADASFSNASLPVLQQALIAMDTQLKRKSSGNVEEPGINYTRVSICHCSKRRKIRNKIVKRVLAISEKVASIPDDEYSWRKYGQKPIKGSPYPRGHYKCSTVNGCPAKKHVERAQDNPDMLVITYEGEHMHYQAVF